MASLMKDPTVRFSALACAVGLGGFLVWAGFVPLSEGVPANGMVVVENSRQVVQHLEGGIIEELLRHPLRLNVPPLLLYRHRSYPFS